MYNIYSTVKERLQRFLMAESLLVEDALEGSRQIKIYNDALDFSSESLNHIAPHLLMMDEDSTGERVETGFEGAEFLSVNAVDISSGVIRLSQPLKRDWLVSKKSFIRRSPGGLAVADVKIGDLAVVSRFPTVCVVPTDKNIDWTALALTKHTVGVEIVVYIESGNTEQGTIDALKVTDVIEWIFMSNLHMKVEGGFQPWNVVSYSGIKNINYGAIQKGNEFLKACKMTWFGEVYNDRTDLYGRTPYERKDSTI